MDKASVSDKVVSGLSRQSYGANKSIAGVELIDFKLHADDGGDFYEIARMEKGLVSGVRDFELKQVNRSRFNPGLVKAFHLHFNQDEIWVVHPLDRLLVGLFDVRKSSETEGMQMRFVLGGGRCSMVFIPRGVAHGGMVLDQKPVDVVYLANQQFSAGNPDEWRLPWDILGVEFWRIMKG